MLNLTPARRNRLILVAALILLLALLLWAARGALFPYLFALALAYVVLPVVNPIDRLFGRWLKGGRAARPLAIAVTYLFAAGLVALFISLVIPVVGEQFKLLWSSRDDLAEGVQRLSERFLGWYRESVPLDIQAQVANALRQASGALLGAVQTGALRTLSVVTSTVSFVLGLVVVPFWLFYVLNDQSQAMRAIVNVVPARLRADFVNLIRIVDGILGKYLRGQLLLCLFIGVMATAGLTLLGVRFPAVLGLIAGAFEILPFVGPILGLVPAVIVAAIQEPLLGVWTLLLFLAIQQVENLFLVPRISGKAVELHPAVIMVVLVIGNQVAGLWGMILAVPVAAILRDVFKYLHLRFQDEPVSPKDAMARLGRTPVQLDV